MKGGSGRKKYTKKYTAPVSEQGSLYGSSGATTNLCKSISFKSQLLKVTPVVKMLSKGDELSIRKSRNELQAINDSGDVCGSIASANNSTILECIEKGYSYVAVVKSISGNVCIVTVQSA